MKFIQSFVLSVGVLVGFASVADQRPPGDYEPETRYVCHCSCAALNMTQQVRVWDNVRRVHYYVTQGVGLFEYDDRGQNYGFKVPVQPTTSCRYVEGRQCTGLHQAVTAGQPVRLEGRYSNCYREAIAVPRP